MVAVLYQDGVELKAGGRQSWWSEWRSCPGGLLFKRRGWRSRCRWDAVLGLGKVTRDLEVVVFCPVNGYEKKP
jgi:hypothetical protein